MKADELSCARLPAATRLSCKPGSQPASQSDPLTGSSGTGARMEAREVHPAPPAAAMGAPKCEAGRRADRRRLIQLQATAELAPAGQPAS